MSFFKKKRTPLELLAHLPNLVQTMGLDKILAFIAEQLDIKENQLSANPAEAVWAFQTLMVIQALKRSRYSAQSKDIIIDSFKDGSVDAFKQLGLNPRVFAAMLKEFSSCSSEANREQDYNKMAATLLRLSIGNEAANNEKAVGIIARWIVRVNSALDKELDRYKLTS